MITHKHTDSQKTECLQQLIIGEDNKMTNQPTHMIRAKATKSPVQQ